MVGETAEGWVAAVALREKAVRVEAAAVARVEAEVEWEPAWAAERVARVARWA